MGNKVVCSSTKNIIESRNQVELKNIFDAEMEELFKQKALEINSIANKTTLEYKNISFDFTICYSDSMEISSKLGMKNYANFKEMKFIVKQYYIHVLAGRYEKAINVKNQLNEKFFNS